MLTAIVLAALAFFVYRRGVAGYAAAPSGLAVLHRGEAALVSAVAEVMFPGRGALGVSGAEARLPHAVDRYLGALPDAQRWQIRGLFLLVEHLTLFMPGNEPGGRRRFSSLSPASRIDWLSRLANHPNSLFRLLLIALRSIFVLEYVGHPANLSALGLSPFEIKPAVSEAEILFPRIGGASHGIPWTDADRTDPLAAEPLSGDAPRRMPHAARRNAEAAGVNSGAGEASR